jgi:hypothetical protein
VNSAALAVANTQTGNAGFGRAANGLMASSAGDGAFGVQGVNTGTNGIGVDGFAEGTGGTGVLGLAGASGGVGVNGTFNGSGVVGNGAAFTLNVSAAPNANAYAADAAVNAVSESANGTTNGFYGAAGRFAVSSQYNLDPAIFATGRTGVYGLANSLNGSTGVEGVSGSAAGSSGVVATATAASTTGLLSFGYSGSASEAVYFKGGASGTGECDFDGGPGFNCSSDRRLKQDFTAVDPQSILAHVIDLPVWRYRMKGAATPSWYVGPTAQDFRAAFDVGPNDTTINTANAQGVALLAIKGLAQRTDEALAKTNKALAIKDDEIAALKRQLDAETKVIAELKSLALRLSAAQAATQGLAAQRPKISDASDIISTR